MTNFYSQNKNARIGSRIDKTGKLRTETQRRDTDAIKMAISTDVRIDSTNLFIDLPDYGGNLRLDGRSARSLYRLLRKHYGVAKKSRTA